MTSFRFRGARSCAAAACHGDSDAPNSPQAAWRRAYTTWIESDPHAQSHQTLESVRSVQMMERLGIVHRGRIVDRNGYANCAACHNPTPAPHRRSETYYVWDGVGCEHCHGPSDAWISRHHTAAWSRDELVSLGMTATHNLSVRAGVCAGCHVGEPGREVNHDLLAAGHPPLWFEFATYLERLPKHWDETRERIMHADFELQAWLAGQAASAEAGLRLLEDRADRAEHGNAVWPEFAEYQCSACHQRLQPFAEGEEQAPFDHSPGRLPWRTRYILFERIVSASRPGEPPGMLAAALERLRQTMESSAAPDPAEVQHHASAALAAFHFRAPFSHEVLESFLTTAENAPRGEGAIVPEFASDRELAAQVYLAFVAVDRAYHDERRKRGRAITAADRRLTAELQRLRGMLARQTRPSERRDDSGTSGEPAPTAAEIAQLMSSILRQLQQRSDP